VDDVDDEDPSHYFGEAGPAIDIEKDTNGNQADVITLQDQIAIGDPVAWTFEVENTGNVDLANVTVTDTVTRATSASTKPSPARPAQPLNMANMPTTPTSSEPRSTTRPLPTPTTQRR